MSSEFSAESVAGSRGPWPAKPRGPATYHPPDPTSAFSSGVPWGGSAGRRGPWRLLQWGGGVWPPFASSPPSPPRLSRDDCWWTQSPARMDLYQIIFFSKLGQKINFAKSLPVLSAAQQNEGLQGWGRQRRCRWWAQCITPPRTSPSVSPRHTLECKFIGHSLRDDTQLQAVASYWNWKWKVSANKSFLYCTIPRVNLKKKEGILQ